MTDDNNNESCQGANWFTLLAFSVIALVALLTEVGTVSSESGEIKWTVSALSISVALSGLSVIAGILLRSKFTGSAIEGGLAMILLCFWAAVMPYLMSSDNDLAIGMANEVSNANLYFFSWLSIITSFLLWFQYLRVAFKIGKGDKNPDFKVNLWAGLCMASFVAMVSAVRIYRDPDTCSADSGAHCNRTKFAVALGAASAFLSTLWLVLGAVVPAILDAFLSVVLMVAWIFGIIYITFGGEENAPGARIGNLYFSTWISFVLTVILTSTGVRTMLTKKNEPEPNEISPDEEMGKDDAQFLQEEDPVVGTQEIKA